MVTLRLRNTHMLWTVSSWRPDFAPSRSAYQVLRVGGLTRSEIGSEVHKELRIQRVWHMFFFIIPVIERFATSCDHLTVKKGLSYTPAARDSTIGTTAGRQMDFKIPSQPWSL